MGVIGLAYFKTTHWKCIYWRKRINFVEWTFTQSQPPKESNIELRHQCNRDIKEKSINESKWLKYTIPKRKTICNNEFYITSHTWSACITNVLTGLKIDHEKILQTSVTLDLSISTYLNCNTLLQSEIIEYYIMFTFWKLILTVSCIVFLEYSVQGVGLSIRTGGIYQWDL